MRIVNVIKDLLSGKLYLLWTALDMVNLNGYFSYFLKKAYVVGTLWKHLNQTLPMITKTNVLIVK